jgi:hypothetical protein
MPHTTLALCLILMSTATGYARLPFVSHLYRDTTVALQTDTEWIKFNSPEGRFSVLLPHEPKFESIAATGSDAVTNYRYSDLEKGYGFICEYFDVESTGDVQSFLDVTRDGIVRGAGATKLGEEKISLKTYPGRELLMALTVNEGTEMTIVTRIYLVNKRLYSITFLHLKTMDATEAAALSKKFFSSFDVKPAA